MKSYLKNMCLIYSIIFTFLTSLHFIRGEELTREVVRAFMVMSLVSGGTTFLLSDNGKYSKRRLMINQVVYLVLIMLTGIGITYFYGWEQSVFTIAINVIIIIGLYVLIKYMLFHNDKKEAESMNEALKEWNKTK